MKSLRQRFTLRTELLLSTLIILVLPLASAGIYGYVRIAASSTPESGGALSTAMSNSADALSTTGQAAAWFLGLGLLTMLLLAVYASFLYWHIRRRIDIPLKTFNDTLEDISEGFLEGSVPESIFTHAESGITDSFEKVIRINTMMLKNVDSLEKGFEEERLAKLEQAALTQAYQRFVPHEFISFLNKRSITEVDLGDHIQTRMTILFSDMRSFTSLSEQITPEENFKFLNSYLMKMEPVVKRHQGFIDKFIGDAIMALFHQGADHALRAALDMFRELHDYNEGRRRAGYVSIQIGIGLNTGQMMLGIIGGEHRMEGTVISDAVNLASRIEEMNKAYGTMLLISKNTYDSLQQPTDYAIRRIDQVIVKGKSDAVHIYEVFEADPPELCELKRQTMPLFEQGLAAYENKRIDLALPLFEECLRSCPLDQTAQIYVNRCQELQETFPPLQIPERLEKAGEPHA